MRGLDRKVDIERKTIVLDEAGQEVETWTKVVTRRSAWMKPIGGEEHFTADQWVARQQVEFRVRWSQLLSLLNPLDRIIYPASSDAESPGLEAQIYEIIEVNELGRREALQIMTARRAEEET